MTRTIHVIINPASGGDDLILNTLNDAFHDRDIVWDVSLTHKKDDAERHAKRLLDSGGVDVLAVYGGDGTIGEVANVLVGTDLPLMVLPGGTGNAFARSLRIPLDLKPAVAILADENAYHIETIDTGLVNGEHAFTVGGATGIVADTFSGASRDEKDRMGMFAYYGSMLRELLDAEPMTYRLTLDDEEIEHEGISCFIVNAGNMGLMGMSFFEDLDIQDGMLDVYMMENNSAGLIMDALMDVSSVEVPTKGMPHWRAKHICIATADGKHGNFFCDGEVTVDLPVEIEARSDSLKVVAPV